MLKFFRNITNLPDSLGYLLAVLAWALWVPDILQTPTNISLYFSIALCLINGFLFVHTCQKGGFVQTFSPLPLFVFFLWFGAFKQWHTDIYIHIAVLVWLIITRLIQDSFRSERAMKPVYITSLLLSVCSLFMPPMIVLIPIVWIGIIERRAWQGRVVLATLLAIATIAICFSIAFYFNLIDIYTFAEISSGQWFSDSMLLIVLLSITLLFAVIALPSYMKENTNQRFLILWATITFVSTMLLGTYHLALFPSVLCLALLASVALQTYCFTSVKSVLTGILFLLQVPLAATVWYFL